MTYQSREIKYSSRQSEAMFVGDVRETTFNPLVASNLTDLPVRNYQYSRDKRKKVEQRIKDAYVDLSSNNE